MRRPPRLLPLSASTSKQYSSLPCLEIHRSFLIRLIDMVLSLKVKIVRTPYERQGAGFGVLRLAVCVIDRCSWLRASARSSLVFGWCRWSTAMLSQERGIMTSATGAEKPPSILQPKLRAYQWSLLTAPLAEIWRRHRLPQIILLLSMSVWQHLHLLVFPWG